MRAATELKASTGSSERWAEDALFGHFARDLARRIRRPRSYPPAPSLVCDALEQLCGGTVTIPTPSSSEPYDLDPSDPDAAS